MLTAPLYHLDEPLEALERLTFNAWSSYARWKWRSFSKEDRTFLKRLEKRGISLPVIWDIGASNGSWSMMVSSTFPAAQVHLFEPLAQFDKTYCKALRGHLAKHSNWHLHPFAIGSSVSTATLYKDGPSFGSTFIENDFAKANWTPINVPVSTIASLVEDTGLPVPSVIKVDTQGFELEILKGAGSYLAKTKVFLLETWLSRAYGPQTPLLNEIIDLLAPMGFVVAEIHAGYCDPDGMMHSVDAFFLRQDLATQYGVLLPGSTSDNP